MAIKETQTCDIAKRKHVGLAIHLDGFGAEIDAGCRDVVIEVPLAGPMGEERQEASLSHAGITDDYNLELLRRTHFLGDYSTKKIFLELSFAVETCCCLFPFLSQRPR